MQNSLSSLRTFSRAAAFAGFLQLWREAAQTLLGPGVDSDNAAILGAAIALVLAPRGLRATNVFLAVVIAIFLSVLAFPGSHWTFFAFSESMPWLIALHAAVFSLVALSLRRFLEKSPGRIPGALLGLAAGLFLHEFAFLPHAGWVGATVFWGALFFFSGEGVPVEEKADASATGKSGLAMALALGFLLGAVFATQKLFLSAHLSSTRFSSSAILGVFLLGLGLGAALSTSFSLSKRGLATRSLVFVAGGVLAPAIALWTLTVLAAAPYSRTMEDLSSIHPGLGEIFLCVQAMGFGAVALGISLPLLAPQGGKLSLLLLGLAGAIWLGPRLLPSHFSDLCIPQRPGEQVFERKITDQGILRRVRAPKETHAAAIRWNRDPLSRQAEWTRLEQEEMFLPARLHPSATRALVLGTPFRSHRTALAIAAPARVEVVDPIPAFLDESTQDRDQVSGLTRHAYDWIALLSSPSLVEGRGRWLTEDFFAAASTALRPNGSLIVWAELRSLAPENVATLLRSFCSVFPKARLWIGQDLYAGPLLGLDSGAMPVASPAPSGIVFLLAEGESLRRLAGKGAHNTLLQPRLESAPPIRIDPLGLPSPKQLRSFASIFSPEPSDRSGFFFFLDSLALHAEAQIPGSLFSSKNDRVVMENEELEQATIGIEMHADFLPLRDHLIAIGNLLLEKKEYQKALAYFPRWVEAAPDESVFLSLLATTHHDLLDDALALPLAEKAAALTPENPSLHELLGDVNVRLKRGKEAAESFRLAVTLSPQTPRLEKKLGLAYLEAGELGQAADWLLRASVTLPGDQEISNALTKLNLEPFGAR